MKTMENRKRGSAGQHQGAAMKKGWQKKNLGDLCDVVGGGTPPKDKPAFYSGDIPWATVRDMRQDVITETEFRITKDAVKSSATNIIPSGNVVIATRVGLGKVCLIGQDTAINQDLRGIVPRSDKALVVRYLYWWLKSIADVIVAEGTGATVQGVKLPFVKSLQIPFPPLAEQQRIVGLLDEAFEGLATAKANAEKNLQNARALFESHLQSVFTQRGEGWVEKRLEEVCGLQNGFAFKSSTFKPSGAPILRISNIQDGRIEAGNRLVFFDPKDYRENLDRYRIVEDDLLIAMSGATTGKLGFNTESTVYYLNQRVGKFEPSEKLNKRFLYHFLSTKVEENLRISAGAAQPNLSTEQIKGFVLPLPSVDEQERIVEALETLSEETQRLARLYERKLAALEALKKSILNKAFSGKL